MFAAWTLYRASGHSLNVEGALWNVISDLSGSVAALISSVLVLIFQWEFVDPVLSVLIGVLIMAGSFRLALKVVNILLENAPAGLDVYQLCSRMEGQEGVTLVHDIHAWTITTGYNALAAHVLVDPDYEGDIELLMRRLYKMTIEEFGVQHVTLQMERSAVECSERHHVDHLNTRALSEA